MHPGIVAALNDHYDNLSSRVNSLANDGTAAGWAETSIGWWEGTVWKNGVEISMQDVAPANITDIGEATAASSDGSMVVGINAWDDQWNQRGYTYNALSGELTILDIYEECPPWDWFCWGANPFNPYDISDDGTMVGAYGSADASGATLGMCEADLPLQLLLPRQCTHNRSARCVAWQHQTNLNDLLNDALAVVLMQTTFYIFVKDTSNQRLVRDAFSKGLFLQPSKVFRSKPNIDSGIFLKHSFGIYLMSFPYIGCILNGF